ncbi:MAG: signal recognition particle protein, partial [Opitutales bacterium]|nr:signal recognition particle protein [Opitutales bacterium]
TEAIILSMTVQERRAPRLLRGSRLKRIAQGSGVQVRDVNALLKQFGQMQKMMKMMNGGKGRKMMKAMKAQMGEGGGMPGLPGM